RRKRRTARRARREWDAGSWYFLERYWLPGRLLERLAVEGEGMHGAAFVQVDGVDLLGQEVDQHALADRGRAGERRVLDFLVDDDAVGVDRHADPLGGQARLVLGGDPELALDILAQHVLVFGIG